MQKIVNIEAKADLQSSAMIWNIDSCCPKVIAFLTTSFKGADSENNCQGFLF